MKKSNINRIQSLAGLKKVVSKPITYAGWDIDLAIDDDDDSDLIDGEETLKVGESTVLIDQSHGCCAKTYLYDWNAKLDDIAVLLKAGEIVSKAHGYSSIGITHQANNPVVKAALKQGYKVLRRFTNKRTTNKLVDLVKDI